MIAFVDTSAVYAVLDRDDKNHPASLAIWRRLLEGDAILVTSNYVLVETCALVQHRLGLEAIRAFQQQIAPVLAIEWISPAQHDSAVAAVLAPCRENLTLVACARFTLTVH